MTSIKLTDILLCLLLLNQVCSEEPKNNFRAKGGDFLFGYCFGVDYIVVYKHGPNGDTLLGNSSDKELTNTPPALSGRIHINDKSFLLGLILRNLSESDSGIYKRECWQNHTRVSNQTEQLSVCKEEISPMTIMNQDGGMELLCNSTLIGRDKISVRWYHEIFPADKPVLFLDTAISLEPLTEDLQGVVEVKENGALLILDKTLLRADGEFFCKVIQDDRCLSFQNMYKTEHAEIRDVYVIQGDRVVLRCPADGDQQLWATPLGTLNKDHMVADEMYISADDSEDFSLIIPIVTEQHSGAYSCLSVNLEIQYTLYICFTPNYQDKVGYKGDSVTLQCHFEKDSSQRLLWYRSESFEIISDSDDKSVPIPEDLSGRLSLSDPNGWLTISDLGMEDAGVYGCLILRGPVYTENNTDYKDYYDMDMNTDEYEYEMGVEEMCKFKHETILTVLDRKHIETEVHSTHAPQEVPNSTGYAVGAGVAGVVVIVAVIVGIVKYRKRAASGERSSIQMTEDPGCTESLTGTVL